MFRFSLVRVPQRRIRRVTCFDLWLSDQAGDARPARYRQLGIQDDPAAASEGEKRGDLLRRGGGDIRGPPAQKTRPFLGSESETKNGIIFRAHNTNLYVSQGSGPHFWAQIPRPKMVSLFGPEIDQPRYSGRGQLMAAVLPDFVPPWRAT